MVAGGVDMDQTSRIDVLSRSSASTATILEGVTLGSVCVQVTGSSSLAEGSTTRSTPGISSAIACVLKAGRSKTSERNTWGGPKDGVDRFAEDINTWREAGGSHVSVITPGLGLDSVEAHLECLATVAVAAKLMSKE